MSKHWTRREFLRGTSAGALVAPSLIAGSAERENPAPAYVARFLTKPEWNFINAAVDRLIPADDSGPGGIEAGVPEFLDRQLDSPYGYGAFAYMQGPFLTNLPAQLGYQLSYSPRELYRLGIAAADGRCQELHGRAFFELEAAQQEDFLSQLEHGSIQLTRPPSQAF